MSQFGLLLDELSGEQHRRAAPRRTVTPACSLPMPRTRPDPALRKALDDLDRMEGKTTARAAEMALSSQHNRIADIRHRAKALIEKSMAEIRELIAVGGITAQEVAERQILLDAFAQRMGL